MKEAGQESARLEPERERLVQSSTILPKLVKRMARKTKVFAEPELMSIGYLSLRRAARNFDPNVGTPFDGYAYRFVHQDLLRAISSEHRHHRREETGAFDAAYDHLERATDPGDIWSDTPADARRHVAELSAGIMVTVALRVLSDASMAPSERDLERHIDWEKRRRKLWNAIGDLGDKGRVLVLRYVEGLGWEQVASTLGRSVATTRRDHDEVVCLLAARLAPFREKSS